MPSKPDAGRWPYVNAKRAQDKAASEVAALKARIERLEAQIIDLGHDPVP